MARTLFHGPKGVRAIEVRLYFEKWSCTKCPSQTGNCLRQWSTHRNLITVFTIYLQINRYCVEHFSQISEVTSLLFMPFEHVGSNYTVLDVSICSPYILIVLSDRLHLQLIFYLMFIVTGPPIMISSHPVITSGSRSHP